MIKKLFWAIAMVGAVCSCNQKMSVSNQMEGQVTTVSFNVPVQQTKAAAPFAEEAVNSLQVFVFNLDGKLDASGTATASSLSLTCTTGQKEIFALVNAAAQTGVKTKAELLEKKTDLKENTSAGLVMEGYLKTNIAPNSSVSVPVYRNVARVSLKSVKSAFELDVYKNQEFKINKVMLVNVAGDKKITGNQASDTGVLMPYTAVPSLWYNQRGDVVNPLAMLCDNVAGVAVTAVKPYNVNHYYYCYPNPTVADSSAEAWSPRHTRLVVCTTLGGVPYYYPISIPEIKSNMCYDVTLTVTRPGSTSPDVPVEKLDGTFSIEVKPWGKTENKDEII